MIRRLEIDLVRNLRAFVKRSPYKFAVGGTLTAYALYSLPTADCAGKDNNNIPASVEDAIARVSGDLFLPLKHLLLWCSTTTQLTPVYSLRIRRC